MSFWAEVEKIPSVTRFLCASSLAVTGPCLMHLVWAGRYVFVRQLVTQRYQLWRIPTSFFLGGLDISYIFELLMLYQNSNSIESGHYPGRAVDYAWQLLFGGVTIMALNLPLATTLHSRPFLLMLVYLYSRLAPPGTQTSLFGLFSFPLVYWPYILVGIDLVQGGPIAAARAFTGLIAGHLWFWGIWETDALRRWGAAPRWLRRMIGSGTPPSGTYNHSGVHVVPPRHLREQEQVGSYRWGGGQRLGSG